MFAIQTNKSKILILSSLLFCIITDYLTKKIMITLLEGGKKHSFGGEFIQFSLVKNYDGFLGIAAPLPGPLRNGLLYGGVALLILACLAYLFSSKPSNITVPLLFVTGGGLGNLLDRVLHNGGVTDFLSIGIGTFRTGIFNLADIYILDGSAVLGYYVFSSSPCRRIPDFTD